MPLALLVVREGPDLQEPAELALLVLLVLLAHKAQLLIPVLLALPVLLVILALLVLLVHKVQLLIPALLALPVQRVVLELLDLLALLQTPAPLAELDLLGLRVLLA